jgi:hypothetical protein
MPIMDQKLIWRREVESEGTSERPETTTAFLRNAFASDITVSAI